MEQMVENILLGVVRAIPWWVWGAFLLSIIIPALFGKPNHWLRVLGSYLALRKFRQIGLSDGTAAQFHFLRTRDPFLFEEMILSALKQAGHRIKRNHRYTGDGGIDGRCWINGETYYIQAKRYKSHINASHVKEFDAICKRDGKKGLFVHTGKTGKTAWRETTNTIKMVSGMQMLTLIGGQFVLEAMKECE